MEPDFKTKFLSLKDKIANPYHEKTPILGKGNTHIGDYDVFSLKDFSKDLLSLNTLKNEKREQNTKKVLDLLYKREILPVPKKPEVGEFYQERPTVPIKSRPFYEALLRIDTEAQKSTLSGGAKEVAR